MKQNTHGFTIVELLIVIVVVGILAAISVVTYIGIQNRAHDTAVQTDLANFGKQLSLKTAETGTPPAGGLVRTSGGDTGMSTTFSGITFKPSKGSYGPSNQFNFYYCTGTETATGQTSFRIMARSKSGMVYEFFDGTVKALGVGVAMQSPNCLAPYGNIGSYTLGHTDGGIWASWTN